MRITILLLGLMVLCLNTSAQLTKEHAFNDQASVSIHKIRLENSGQKICVVNRIDSISYEYVFYNSDYTEFRTISIDLGPLFVTSDYNSPSLDVSYIAENVFDQDADIDLLGQLTYFDNPGAEYAQVVIFHENGSTLFKSDVDNSNAWILNSSVANSSLTSSLMNTDEGAKMILDVFYFNEGLFSYDVYDLPGSLPSGIMEREHTDLQADNYLRAYPVPAGEFVDLDYKLAGDQLAGIIEIADEQGRLIQRIRVNANRGTIRIPLVSYNSGPYLYRVNTGRGTPRSGKIVIVK